MVNWNKWSYLYFWVDKKKDVVCINAIYRTQTIRAIFLTSNTKFTRYYATQTDITIRICILIQTTGFADVSRINLTIILCKHMKKKGKIENHTRLLIYSAYTINFTYCRVWNKTYSGCYGDGTFKYGKVRPTTFELR